MDYSLDEQERDVSELAALIIGKGATAERLAALDADGEAFHEQLWSELAQAGLVGLAVPEHLGGSGAGYRELCLVIEQAASHAAPLFLVDTTLGAALPLTELGTDEQKKRLVTPFAAGELLLTSAIPTVPGTRTGVRATDAADGWILEGTVSHVALAERAARILILADDDGGRPGLFLVDPAHVELARQSSVDRRGRHHVSLSSYVVPDVDVVAAPGALDAAALDRIVAKIVAARCIEAVGTAQGALSMTASYVSERQQFGRPIGSFQAVSHKVADAYVDVQGIHLTSWRAAWLLSEGIDEPEATAIAAYWAAVATTRVLETAMQLHGGISVDLDFPLHRYYLAARQECLTLGGPDRRLRELADLMAVA